MDDSEITALEREIISGASVIAEEEDDIVDQYKQDMEKMTSSFNIDSETRRDDYDSGYGESSKSNDFQDYGYSSNYKSSGNYETAKNDLDFLDISIEDKQLKYMTNEQKRQNYVDEALHGIENEVDASLAFDIDKEKDEDDKNTLLEQIDMLRDTLEDDGVNLSNVPMVSKNNSLSDITNIYKILKLKNDRNRYCSFAEEMILSCAYGLESMFDGKKPWFGYTPDLVGWSSTVRIKLRRSRFQTSTLVKDIMHNYNMGPGFQLFLELVPSMFLYSRAKSASNSDKSRDDDKYAAAISNLNDSFDTRDN
ncbi:MAG: hypothetical protein ACRCZI_07480 [Cetobacterium sp.]